MPTPNKGEKQSDFVSRCIGDPEANKSFPDQKQREAFCYSQWRKHVKDSKMSAEEVALLQDLGHQMAGIVPNITPKVPPNDQAPPGVPGPGTGPEPKLAALKGVEIFSVGEWKGNKTVKADAPMLDRMAKNFSDLSSKTSGFGVPIKIGHNSRVGEPAFGWADNVYRDGNVLKADFTDVPPELIDAIQSRRYNNVSIEYLPKVDHGGQTYNDVLSAVAVLGAEWPAVKGLKPLSASIFSGEEFEKIELTTKETEMTFTQADIDAAIEKATGPLKDKLTIAETAVKTFAAEKVAARVTAFVEKGEKSGFLLPKFKDDANSLLTALAQTKVGEEDALTVLERISEGFTGKVDFRQRSEDVDRDPAVGGTASVADEINALAQRKVAASAGKLAYADAVAQVFAERPDLKSTYGQGAA